MFEVIPSLTSDALSSSEGVSVVFATLLVFITCNLGIAISRQWYFIIVQIALLILTAFLLNPFADSTSLLDLKEKLSSLDTICLLGSIQLCLLATGMYALWRFLQSDVPRRRERWQIVLALCSVFPQPILALTLLLAEQSILSHLLNSRPERIGIYVGVAAAIFASLTIAVTLLFTPTARQFLYALFSLSALAAISLLLTVQTPLPEFPTESFPTLPEGSWLILPAVAATIAVGSFLSYRKQRGNYPLR